MCLDTLPIEREALERAVPSADVSAVPSSTMSAALGAGVVVGCLGGEELLRVVVGAAEERPAGAQRGLREHGEADHT